ncbi:FAD-dependent monooxygenase [Streptomyces oceani]|uniref:Monooxygenase n=1 Tax=Streptomyces oceani TaxID=1075402 RepID=A0A1E7KL88_9ACTN|nr:FAD-dependent monooxygenase [Streptomyces oceani]OEV04715.1 monooxygenase [Streptomyces oceani]
MDPVIVIGAGPVGLALALALARYAVPSVVLDSSDGTVHRRAARTCLLRPDTAALLPRLGGSSLRGWRTERRSQCVRRVELADEAAPLHVTQHDLMDALHAALDAEGLTRVVPHSRLRSLEQDAEGVTAHLRYAEPSGPTGAAEPPGTAPPPVAEWRGSYLVGCDGARSMVRKCLGIRFTGRTSVERHAVATVRTRLPWSEEALLHREPGGVTGEVRALPLPGQRWRLDWLLPPRGELVTPERLVSLTQETLSAWWQGDESATPPAYELLDTGVHTAHQRLARRWRHKRAFLAGDAAHLVGALGVQGTDEGLRDATNLAWKLALAWHHQHTESADTLLDSYESERRAAVGARLRAVDQTLPLVRRGDGVRSLLPGKGARTQLGLLLDSHLGRGLLGAPPGYGRSPLTPQRAMRSVVPVETPQGGVVQDVPVTNLRGEGCRLWQHLGRQRGALTALLVAPGTGVWESRHWLSAGLMPALARAVSTLPLRTELLVTENYPGAAAHTVLLIRPDGHLVTALPGTQEADLQACVEFLWRGASDQGQDASEARSLP